MYFAIQKGGKHVLFYFIVYEEWDFLTEQYTEENFLTNLNDSLIAAVFNVKTIFIVILIVAVVGIISYIRENKLKYETIEGAESALTFCLIF